MANRWLLGKETTLFGRSRLYVAPDCFEVDAVEGHFLARRRIYYDDVLLVTLHVERAAQDWIFGLMGCSVAACGVLGFGAAAIASDDAGLAFLLVALAFGSLAFPSVPLLARGRRVVTIFGRRTKGRAAWPYRHERAAQAFVAAVDRVRVAQARQRAAAPPPADEPPIDWPSPEPELPGAAPGGAETE